MSCAAAASSAHERGRPDRPAALDPGRQRVGLLGGSFNPAHAGHRHLSLWALKRLGLDQVWWLVSPQNPLKASRDMAPLADRLAEARRVARHPAIRVTDIEGWFSTRYTADTLSALLRRFPHARFVWLMGADNLRQIRRWKRWNTIFESLPVAVFDRPSYALGALSGLAARRYGRHRVPASAARSLADRPAPAWTFVTMPLHPASATRIRAARERPEACPAPLANRAQQEVAP
ncbi:putative nicotinate-nucleotide adenylyltransferase [Allostella vacuolata]|nr:putative nicotinate-nucleotide adenylyltransferase [Stella vacuolata]